jgi:hypothetical protein
MPEAMIACLFRKTAGRLPESQTLRRKLLSAPRNVFVALRYSNFKSPCCRLRKPVHILRSPHRSSLNAVVLRATTAGRLTNPVRRKSERRRGEGEMVCAQNSGRNRTYDAAQPGAVIRRCQ